MKRALILTILLYSWGSALLGPVLIALCATSIVYEIPLIFRLAGNELTTVEQKLLWIAGVSVLTLLGICGIRFISSGSGGCSKQ